jgi:hypothetical protein
MNKYIVWDLNNSAETKKCNLLWAIENKHLVIIVKSIVEKLGITDNSIVFLEQQVTPDNTILMKIKKF